MSLVDDVRQTREHIYGLFKRLEGALLEDSVKLATREVVVKKAEEALAEREIKVSNRERGLEGVVNISAHRKATIEALQQSCKRLEKQLQAAHAERRIAEVKYEDLRRVIKRIDDEAPTDDAQMIESVKEMVARNPVVV